MPSQSHDRLVQLGARWLKRNGFPVVATELRCAGAQEQPDVIGFRSSCSAVIEVKVSRSDFQADQHKTARAEGQLGVYRFYLCPAGLISPLQVPEHWGLLEADRTRVDARQCPRGNLWPGLGNPLLEGDSPPVRGWTWYQHTPDPDAERAALFSIARRLSR